MKSNIEKVKNEINKGNIKLYYDLGEIYRKEGDFKTAFECYMQATKAERPNPNVYFNIAFAYQFGEGVPVDLISAVDWYEEAVKHKLPHAMQNLAFFYQNGIVVPKDMEKAEALCKESMASLIKSEDQLYEIQIRNEELSDLYKKVSQLNEELLKRITQLSEEHASEKREYEKTVNSQIAEISTLKERICQLDNLLTKEKELCAERLTCINELKEKVNNLENDLSHANNLIKIQASDIENKKNIISNHEATIKSLENDLKKANSDIQEYLGEIECLKETNKKLDSIVSDKVEQINGLNDEITSKNSEINKQKEDISVLETQKPFMLKKSVILLSNIFSFLLVFAIYGMLDVPDTSLVFGISVASIILVLMSLCLKGKVGKVFLGVGITGKVIALLYNGWIEPVFWDLHTLFLYGELVETEYLNFSSGMILIIYLLSIVVEFSMHLTKEVIISKKEETFVIDNSGRRSGLRKSITILTIIAMLVVSLCYSPHVEQEMPSSPKANNYTEIE